MSRRAAALGVGAVAVLALVALVWWSAGRDGREEAPAGAEEPEAASLETTDAELFFPGTSGWLGRESRELVAAGSAEERARQVVAALLAGPAEPIHRPPLADAAELAALHLTGDGIVYVDLENPQLASPPVSGSRGELLAVYSLVNSILANVPQARGVVLMWNGNQRPTFAGHVDTTRPLPAERKWVAKSSG